MERRDLRRETLKVRWQWYGVVIACVLAAYAVVWMFTDKTPFMVILIAAVIRGLRKNFKRLQRIPIHKNSRQRLPCGIEVVTNKASVIK
jgi:hypothetical protein